MNPAHDQDTQRQQEQNADKKVVTHVFVRCAQAWYLVGTDSVGAYTVTATRELPPVVREEAQSKTGDLIIAHDPVDAMAWQVKAPTASLLLGALIGQFHDITEVRLLLKTANEQKREAESKAGALTLEVVDLKTALRREEQRRCSAEKSTREADELAYVAFLLGASVFGVLGVIIGVLSARSQDEPVYILRRVYPDVPDMHTM